MIVEVESVSLCYSRIRGYLMAFLKVQPNELADNIMKQLDRAVEAVNEAAHHSGRNDCASGWTNLTRQMKASGSSFSSMITRIHLMLIIRMAIAFNFAIPY